MAMGLKLNINFILRTDVPSDITPGNVYTFSKEGSLFIDTLPIWLTEKDWTARAEIQVLSQTRENNTTTITYQIKHVYANQEQTILTNIFRRMYGWD
jgi:hypothetical protein